MGYSVNVRATATVIAVNALRRGCPAIRTVQNVRGRYVTTQCPKCLTLLMRKINFAIMAEHFSFLLQYTAMDFIALQFLSHFTISGSYCILI
jgi:hypothetical protein